MATKEEVTNQRIDLKQEIADFRLEFKQEIAALRSELLRTIYLANLGQLIAIIASVISLILVLKK